MQSRTPRHHDISNHSDTTMDMTAHGKLGPRSSSGDRTFYNYNSNHIELKQALLDEKERRLNIQDQLQRSLDDRQRYKHDNDKLQEMMHQSLPNANNQGLKLSNMQERLDDVLDENVTLKLRVSELESDIIDEKHNKQVKYDFTVDHLKS
jgi:hypothetical protein